MNHTLNQAANAYADAGAAWARAREAEQAVQAEEEDLKVDKFLHIQSLTGVVRQTMDNLAQVTMIYMWRMNEGNYQVLEAARLETVRVTADANTLLDSYGY